MGKEVTVGFDIGKMLCECPSLDGSLPSGEAFLATTDR
jgi:hypothetical protein